MSNGGASPGSLPSVDVVVDASVAVKWFVPEDLLRRGRRLAGREVLAATSPSCFTPRSHKPSGRRSISAKRSRRQDGRSKYFVD